MNHQKRYDDTMNAALRCEEKMKAGAAEGEYLPWLFETVVGALNFAQKECSDQSMKNLLEAVGWSLLPHLRSRMQARGVVKKITAYYQRLGIDRVRFDLVEAIRERLGEETTTTEASELAAELLDREGHPAGDVDSTAIRHSHKRYREVAGELPDEWWELPGMMRVPAAPDPGEFLASKQ